MHRGADDVEARSDMMMAATFAGMGFGNSGVHIPHANAYPIAGMVRDYRPAGYPQDEPMVPHGQSVSLTAPEAFRFSFESAPERHLRAAELLDPRADRANDQREQLPSVLVALMRDIGIPNGIGGVGYTEADVPDLVPGTMKQQRLLATCPKTPTEDDIAGILTQLRRELVAGADLRLPVRRAGVRFEHLAAMTDTAAPGCPCAAGRPARCRPASGSAAGRTRGCRRTRCRRPGAGCYDGSPEYVDRMRRTWEQRQKLEERHPEIAGDQRPILAHEGRYEQGAAAAGRPGSPPTGHGHGPRARPRRTGLTVCTARRQTEPR